MFESISLLSNACRNLGEKCVSGITANKEICEAYVFNSIGIVTYLNPFIGHHNGISSVRFVRKPARVCAKWFWSAVF